MVVFFSIDDIRSFLWGVAEFVAMIIPYILDVLQFYINPLPYINF